MYQPISSLELPEYKIKEFIEHGYFYCNDMDVSDETFLTKNSLEEWCTLNTIPDTESALDLYQNEGEVQNVSSFIGNFDAASGGGINLGEIMELCGLPGSGKTQLCARLPVKCGGIAGEAIYICTNDGFARHRLEEIATSAVNNCTLNANNLNANMILSGIHCITSHAYVDLLAVITYLCGFLVEHPNVRLIIIDSISSPLRSISFKEKTQFLYDIFSMLRKLAKVHNFAVVVTNDMTTKVGPNNTSCSIPSLGGSYYHLVNVRIEMSKISSTLFQAAVVKSVFERSTEVQFTLPF